MPSERCCMSSSVVNGRIYVIGGAPAWVAVLSAVEEYDSLDNRWVKRLDMPTARAFLSSSSINGKIYAVGGIAWGWQPLRTVEEYDPGILIDDGKSIEIAGKMPVKWGIIKSK